MRVRVQRSFRTGLSEEIKLVQIERIVFEILGELRTIQFYNAGLRGNGDGNGFQMREQRLRAFSGRTVSSFDNLSHAKGR